MADNYNFFLGKDGHLRSGWRAGFFAVALYICAKILQVLVLVVFALTIHRPADEILNSNWGFAIQAGILFTAATLVGWGCGAVFEGLPFRALGWSWHRGWLRDFAAGSGIGAGSLLLAAVLGIATRSFQFSPSLPAAASIEKTLVLSLFVFVFAAAAEEVLFRGYPLQTLTRANLAWLGVLLTSVPFAVVHLGNPNVVRGFTFLNTALAGVWLAVAYLRTRSLWFPLGLHWSWNWVQASILGLPVSGIDRLAPAPLLHAIRGGPDWLTGGAYGIEGGAACTVALLISTIFIWRTGLVSSSDKATTAGSGTVTQNASHANV
jgi:membrane protease YdiL (CAAX protease family)